VYPYPESKVLPMCWLNIFVFRRNTQYVFVIARSAATKQSHPFIPG